MKNNLFILFVVLFIYGCKDKEDIKDTTVYVRKNAHSEAAKADLEAYNVALEKMRSLDCNNPLSWYYQAAMHNIPPYDSMVKYGGMDSLCRSYTGVLKKGWATCPHMKPGLEQYHFLTWHRLYLYYFEKIIRKLSGKADFALPYWNYNLVANRTLPEQFRDSAFKGLYEIERSPSLMKGDIIDAAATDNIVMNVQIMGKDTIVIVKPNVAMAAILDTGYLWTASDIHHFSYELEDVVHNCIHDYVGATLAPYDTARLRGMWNKIYQRNAFDVGGALMANVPSSAFDPIFYLHHGNVDRLWYAWELDHPALKLTLPEFEKAGWGTKDDPIKYVFFDENGKEVVYTSFKQIYDTIRSINYTYDYLANKKSLLKSTEHALVTTNEKLLGSKSLARDAGGFKNGIQVYELPFEASNTENTFYTLEVDAAFSKTPKTRMAVSVIGTAPTGTEVKNVKDYLVGWVGFFGTSHSDGVHSMFHKKNNEPFASKTVLFDITDELRKQSALQKKTIKVVLQLDNPNAANLINIKNIRVKSYQQQ